jgi:tRNA pseudouridine55 synthase
MNEGGEIFAAWKPKGPTSAEFLNRLKKKMGTRKIGHAGTLDPLASGILVVGVGRAATKRLNMAAGEEKEYLVKIRLGVRSTTGDEEGEKEIVERERFPDIERIEKILPSFVGVVDQVPPVYSALKIKGVPAYKLARRGKIPEMNSRRVKIFSIKILSYNPPYLELKVVTGPGVYVRSLARDVGDTLGVGGYVAELVRTRVGEFTKEDILTNI